MDDKPNTETNTLHDEDLNTTAPNPQPSVWQMPEPVFRRTSGKLAQDFEKNYAPAAEAAPPVDPMAPSVSVDDPNPTPHIEPKPSNPTVKMVLVLLGIVAMIAFIAVFLTVVYFFFLR